MQRVQCARHGQAERQGPPAGRFFAQTLERAGELGGSEKRALAAKLDRQEKHTGLIARQLSPNQPTTSSKKSASTQTHRHTHTHTQQCLFAWRVLCASPRRQWSPASCQLPVASLQSPVASPASARQPPPCAPASNRNTNNNNSNNNNNLAADLGRPGWRWILENWLQREARWKKEEDK